MWNHRSELIKSGPNLCKICTMVALPSVYTDINLGFYILSLVVLEFIKRTLRYDRLFSIDINDPHILLDCVGSWWPAGEFRIISMAKGIVKYSSYYKLKPILFTEGVNWVDIRSSSHGIKLSSSECWRIISGYCWRGR